MERRTKIAIGFGVRGGFAAVFLVLLCVLIAACGGTTTTAAPSTTDAVTVTSGATTTADSTSTTAAKSDIILASTTSTQDSGLFDELLPAFQKAYPQYTVKVIAVGSGEAIKLGESKDADVLLVHSPAAEKEFVEGGYGTERRDVMYNDFIIIGPESDPAAIKGLTSAAEAFAKISNAKATFFSRNDKSGTHTKELAIWKAASISPEGTWYQSTGQGMGETMRIASEKDGYTLADRGTYLSAKDKLALVILVEGDKVLFNQYGVIPVTEAGNLQGANDFADWITSSDGQEVIREFGVEKFGQPLFIPNAD